MRGEINDLANDVKLINANPVIPNAVKNAVNNFLRALDAIAYRIEAIEGKQRKGNP